MKQSLSFIRWSGLLLSIFISSCTPSTEQQNLPSEMRSVYQTTSELFSYAWNPKAFGDPHQNRKISKLLDSMVNSFHRVEVIAPIEAFEPGFQVTLASQQEMLEDVRLRFNAGDKDYANWKLRGILANCISCHSRYQVPHDFIGNESEIDESSPEAKLALAEFMVATRQFERASSYLIQLAQTFSAARSASGYVIRALQLWAIVETRVKDRPAEAASELSRLLKTGYFTDYDQQLVRAWIASFEELAAKPISPSLQAAHDLLQPIFRTRSLELDERNMITTLKASALLHFLLSSALTPDESRKSTYLLAVAYSHIPIDSFQTFKELYLEQCIRLFPHTPEAHSCFDSYEQYVREISSGISGHHVDPFYQKRLKELRLLGELDVQDLSEEFPNSE